MSTVTTSSLSDTLPLTVPKLDAEGDNWAIFLVRFMDAVEAKGFWGHFDGSSSPPVTTTTSSDAEKTALTQWEKDERSAKTLLTQRLPDSTVMEIHSKKTVKERWEAVVKEYTVKGVYAQTEMRAKFLTSRCSEKGNAKDFLRGLRLKKEELAQVGVKISDEEESDWFEEAVAEEDLEGNSLSCSNLVSVEDELGVHDDLPELLSLSDSEDDDSDVEEEFSNREKEDVSIEDLFDTSGEAFIVARISASG